MGGLVGCFGGLAEGAMEGCGKILRDPATLSPDPPMPQAKAQAYSSGEANNLGSPNPFTSLTLPRCSLNTGRIYCTYMLTVASLGPRGTMKAAL